MVIVGIIQFYLRTLILGINTSILGTIQVKFWTNTAILYRTKSRIRETPTLSTDAEQASSNIAERCATGVASFFSHKGNLGRHSTGEIKNINRNVYK